MKFTTLIFPLIILSVSSGYGQILDTTYNYSESMYPSIYAFDNGILDVRIEDKRTLSARDYFVGVNPITGDFFYNGFIGYSDNSQILKTSDSLVFLLDHLEDEFNTVYNYLSPGDLGLHHSKILNYRFGDITEFQGKVLAFATLNNGRRSIIDLSDTLSILDTVDQFPPNGSIPMPKQMQFFQNSTQDTLYGLYFTGSKFTTANLISYGAGLNFISHNSIDCSQFLSPTNQQVWNVDPVFNNDRLYLGLGTGPSSPVESKRYIILGLDLNLVPTGFTYGFENSSFSNQITTPQYDEDAYTDFTMDDHGDFYIISSLPGIKPNEPGHKSYVRKVSKTGNMLWQRIIEIPQGYISTEHHSILVDRNNLMIVSAANGAAFDKDLRLIVFDKDSTASNTNLSIAPLSTKGMITSAYPNPSSNFVTIDIKGQVRFYNTSGQSFTLPNQNGSYDISGLKSGLYFAVGSGGENTRFVKY